MTTDAKKSEEKQEQDRYRFSGYQLPLVQLDDSGKSYVVTPVHQYYIDQPEYWVPPIFKRF